MSAGAAGDGAARPEGALRSAVISVGAALLLIAIKLAAGLLSGSLGLLAEAAHSGTDLIAALLTLFAVRVALRPPDREHPYGHGKAEHLAALGEGAFLLLVSVVIAWQAAQRLLAGSGEHEVEVSAWTFAVLAVIVAIDITRVVTLRRAARRHGSAALSASALHFASDLLGTVAVIAGLTLVAIGFQEADSIAALVVAVLVVIAAVRLMGDNIDVLMDRAPAGVEEMAWRAITDADPGVVPRRVRVRSAGACHFVEATVAYEADAGLGEGHAVADEIEEAVRRALPGSDVVVHVEPNLAEADRRGRASAAALSVRGVREVHDVRVVVVDGHPELSLHVKLPADLDLTAANEVAGRVEDRIAAELPELTTVHLHLEPLVPSRPSARPPDELIRTAREPVERLTEEITGRPARRISFRDGDHGVVAFVTVELPGEHTVERAHEVAGELERRIAAAIPAVAVVVVRTVPLA